jgi:hypothetical protein
MYTSTNPRRSKRPLSTISCPSSTPSSSSEDERPHKKLALSLNRLSLSSTPQPEPEPHEIEMRQRKSYEKDAFTTVIESLSTSTSDNDGVGGVDKGSDSDAPFSRDEAHVTILSEIEKRLTKLPHKLLTPSTPDTALVLYRSPESMGLPKLERQRSEERKVDMKKRILEKRRLAQMEAEPVGDLDGYEADAEDWDGPSHRNVMVNGFQRHDMVDDDVNDLDEGDMMDLD